MLIIDRSIVDSITKNYFLITFLSLSIYRYIMNSKNNKLKIIAMTISTILSIISLVIIVLWFYQMVTFPDNSRGGGFINFAIITKFLLFSLYYVIYAHRAYRSYKLNKHQ